MIDESVINLVRDEINHGKKPEDIIPKLRKLGYSDEEIEQIFARITPGGVTIIKRPSRPTVFKTIFSLKVLGIIVLILLLVGGLYFLSMYLGVSETVEDKAKRIADSTSKAQLLSKSVKLQNSIISCISDFDSDYSEYSFCTIQQSQSITSLGSGRYAISYTLDEDPRCPKNYIDENKYLSIDVDLVSGTKESEWFVDPPFNEETVNSLYPKRDNCNALSQYVAKLINQLSDSES